MSVEIYSIAPNDLTQCVYVESGISAGFPSPADDFSGEKLSLDEKLIKNKEATFYARVKGDSMINAGISDGDLLMVDRSLPVKHNDIAVCFLEQEFTVKRIHIANNQVSLFPENENYPVLKVSNLDDFVVWGVVTYVIKSIYFKD